MTRESFRELAEIGLVMLLFADASRINLKTLRSRERLPLRLLSIGMLLTILLGAITAHLIFPQLSIWEGESLPLSWPQPTPGWGRSSYTVHGCRYGSARRSMWKPASTMDFPSLSFCFSSPYPRWQEGAGPVLPTISVNKWGYGSLVGLAIGLAGDGFCLGLRKGWMAASVQQLGLVTLPILSVLACEPVGGSMFIAAYVAGLAVQVGFRDEAR